MFLLCKGWWRGCSGGGGVENATDVAADAVATGTGDGRERVNLTPEAEVTQEGKNQSLFIIYYQIVRNCYLNFWFKFSETFEKVFVEGAAPGDEKGADVLAAEHSGNLYSNVFHDGT